MLWQARSAPVPSFTPITEAIEQARKAWFARKSGAVFFCDASDVVTAGAPGNNTLIIQSLIQHAQGLTTLVAMRDPWLIDKLQHQEVGDEVDVMLGGHLMPDLYPAIAIQATLTFQGESHGFGRAIVLRQGSIHICVTESSPGVMKAEFYQQLGLSVWKADIVVVKNLFPWRLFCALYNRKSIYVQTQGVTDLDAAKVLNFNRNLYPFDRSVADWKV